MENIEFLLHGLRIMYSFIGTFLAITFGFAVGGWHLYKFCCKLKLCKYNYWVEESLLPIGIILACLLIPFYYIP